MPFVLVANVIFILIWTIRLSPRAFLSFALLLLGYPFILRTITWHNIDSRDTRKGFSVMSYNMMWCDAVTYVHEHDTTNAISLVKKAVDIDADIKSLGKYLSLSTSAGSIHVRMPMDKGMDLDLDGQRVKVPNLSKFNGTVEKDRVKGLLNGGGIAVRMNANSGGVYINE